MAVVFSFPLLLLPKNATTVTLRTMNHLQLFGISTVSKKTRGLIQSMKIGATEFTVSINSEFSVSLWFPGKSFCYIQSLSNRIFLLVNEETTETWHLDEMNERTLIDHLKFVFNCSQIKVEFGVFSEQFDFEPILEGRRDIDSIRVENVSQEERRRILNIMKPPKANIYNVQRSIDFLIQNFNYLYVGHVIIRLEDLLVSNVRNFVTYCTTVPTKVLNRFLKLWMRGSNLRIEILKLSFPIDNNFLEGEIFDRLKITENNTVRYFKSANGTSKITGGTDIFRFDGTMATIVVHKHEYRVFDFAMYAWHDYCIAKEID